MVYRPIIVVVVFEESDSFFQNVVDVCIRDRLVFDNVKYNMTYKFRHVNIINQNVVNVVPETLDMDQFWFEHFEDYIVNDHVKNIFRYFRFVFSFQAV